MVRIRMTLLAVLACASIAATADDARDEAAILATLHAACQAYQMGDVAHLEEALDERFTLTDSSGVITTKREELAAVRKGDPKYEIFRNSAMSVRLYGDAALVTGVTTVKGTSGDKAFHSALQFTDTLIRRDGEWKIAASHVSPVAKATPRP
jgi:ketosteroid isomerase-like protein